MKILYCIPALYNPGGMESILSSKVNYLSHLPDYNVSIVTTDNMGRSLFFSLDEKVNLIHLDINFAAHFHYPIFRKYLAHNRKMRLYRKKLQEILLSEKIDICVSMGGKEIEFLSRLPVPCKKICEMHFAMNFRSQFAIAEYRHFFFTLLGKLRTKQLIRSVRKLDKLIVLTKHDWQQWIRFVDNVVQIPNFTDFCDLRISVLETKKVIAVGRLEPQKSYDVLIDCWSRAIVEMPGWQLHIFGSGSLYTTMQEQIHRLELENTVFLRGVSKSIRQEYADASIYVMTSAYEGLPMVLLEAMSCGLPLLAFNCEYGPGEVIRHGYNGFLVEMGEKNDFVEKLKLLAEDPYLRRKMGKNSLESVKIYDKETVMWQWQELFQSILINTKTT